MVFLEILPSANMAGFPEPVTYCIANYYMNYVIYTCTYIAIYLNNTVWCFGECLLTLLPISCTAPLKFN